MLDRPQADPIDFQQTGRKRWQLTTPNPMRYVSAAGFFDTLLHSGIAPDDRIDVIACGDAPATHALFVIDSIGNESGNRVRASVLTEFRRTKLKAAA